MAPNPEPKSEIAENEAELTKLVMEKDLASRAEVEACLKAQKEASAAGKPAALGDLLVRRGCLTPSQLARLRSSMEATRGQQIPGYQLLSKLGSGSTAAVFKARQISLNRIVALKVMPQRLSRDPDYVKRFYKEGEIAAKLNHPNIVQAIDIGEASGYHYFVMEYVEGKTVHDELAGGKVYTEAEALAIIIQIAKALEYAHAAGLIHRDVKPKNIMLMPDATAKLADMGLARAVDDAAAAQAEAGTLFGTPYYISPEQILARDIDARCDIYALGATLYHMVTGQVPFIGDDPKSVMVKHLKQPLVAREAQPGPVGRAVQGHQQDDGQGPRQAVRQHDRGAEGPGVHRVPAGRGGDAFGPGGDGGRGRVVSLEERAGRRPGRQERRGRIRRTGQERNRQGPCRGKAHQTRRQEDLRRPPRTARVHHGAHPAVGVEEPRGHRHHHRADSQRDRERPAADEMTHALPPEWPTA